MTDCPWKPYWNTCMLRRRSPVCSKFDHAKFLAWFVVKIRQVWRGVLSCHVTDNAGLQISFIFPASKSTYSIAELLLQRNLIFVQQNLAWRVVWESGALAWISGGSNTNFPVWLESKCIYSMYWNFSNMLYAILFSIIVFSHVSAV